MKRLSFKMYDKEGRVTTSSISAGDGHIALYTGFDDLDGKHIYVGDVLTLEQEGFVGIVNQKLHGMFVLMIYTDGEYVKQRHLWRCVVTENEVSSVNGKVIGNIYQNPELLKPKLEKYYLKAEGLWGFAILVKDRDGDYFIGNGDDYEDYQAKFTKKEIEEMPPLFKHFTLIEVDDEDPLE